MQCMFKVILCHVHIITVTVETKQCIPFLLLIHTCHCQEHNKYFKYCHENTIMHYTYFCTTRCCQQHKMQLGLHVKCAIFLSSFNQIWISQQIFLKATNTKFHRNPSSGSNADACRWMGMTKLTDVYANVPKNQLIT